MAIVVEDGSLVDGANSYVSLTFVRDYASHRGYTVPSADAELEVLIHRAMDFIEAHRNRFKGSKVDASQPTQFPRKNLYIDNSCTAFSETAIPIELKNAQSQAVVELVDNDLNPTDVDPQVRYETVGPISTSYELNPALWTGPTFPKIDQWLNPLLLWEGSMVREVTRI